MRVVLQIAAKEWRDGLRNRWVAAAILLLAGLALLLALLGAAPSGGVKASALAVTLASLASLTVYLLPLLALMLGYDALVGEADRGTLLLLLSYPVPRRAVILGKFLGHLGILALALLVGYGGPCLLVALTRSGEPGDWTAFAGLIGSSLLLGGTFLSLGYLVSALVRERATAVGAAIGLWLVMVVLYDLGLLALLVADESQAIGKSLFGFLLLINPTDAFRLFNLTVSDTAALASGMAEAATAGTLTAPLGLAAIAAWLLAALGASILVFQRREL